MASVEGGELALLGRFAALLKACGPESRELDQSLEMLRKALDLPAVALLCKRYTSRKRFRLQRIGLAGTGEVRHFTIEQRHLDSKLWNRLRQGETTVISPGHGGDALLLPLDLDRHLFGFLALWGLPEGDAHSRTGGLLKAVKAILELWLAKCNLDKQVNDILNEVPIPTMVEDTKGHITHWNPAMAKRTGWKAESIVGKGDYIHAVPFYLQRRPLASDLMMYPDPEWETVYVEFRRHGRRASGMSLCPNLPGGPFYFSFDAALCYDLNNRMRGVIEFITDVTEEREVRRELRRSESLYRTVTDFAGVGIILFSRSKILYMNKYVSEMLGVPAGESDIRNLEHLIHPNDRQEVFANFEHLFENPYNPTHFEFRGGQGGRVRHYRGYAGVLDFEDQTTIHFIFDDITIQKELAEKARLNELKLYHEDRLTSLGVMAAGIAHELNQPLNTIRVVAEGLLFGMEQGWDTDPTELREELEMISRQVGRMSKVIHNIRDFARDDQIESMEEININVAVENVFSMIGRQLEARGIMVKKILAEEGVRVEVNLHRMEQVIMNLLVNARQALEGSPVSNRRIWVRTRQSNGLAYLEVADNATGVSLEIKHKIFDPFVTTKEVGQGTGLGLSICKSILTEFKGDIDFYNNQLGGATFTITIPVRR